MFETNFLFQAGNVRGVVLVEKTATSTQYFSDVQKYVVLDMGLKLVPVASEEEAARLLTEVVS